MIMDSKFNELSSGEQHALNQLVLLDWLSNFDSPCNFATQAKSIELTSVVIEILTRYNLVNNDLIEKLSMLSNEREVDDNSELLSLKKELDWSLAMRKHGFFYA